MLRATQEGQPTPLLWRKRHSTSTTRGFKRGEPAQPKWGEHGLNEVVDIAKE